MVDISAKTPTQRSARALARVVFPAEIFPRILSGDVPKGGILEPARIAGIQAAKKTSELIPMCHQLPLDRVSIQFEVASPATIEISCEALTEGKTGVEMEALTGASVAALTLYDMCKALHHGIRIQDVHLVEKKGGKSGTYRA